MISKGIPQNRNGWWKDSELKQPEEIVEEIETLGDPKETIGDRISAARWAAKMSQEKLAVAVGIARRTLQRWEAGEQTPDCITLIKIAKVLETDACWLLLGFPS